MRLNEKVPYDGVGSDVLVPDVAGSFLRRCCATVSVGMLYSSGRGLAPQSVPTSGADRSMAPATVRTRTTVGHCCSLRQKIDEHSLES